VRIIVISGYFNPLHTGHLDYIEGASKLGEKLIVIVNNDAQVELKGSKPFMSESERIRIVSAIKGVHEAILSSDTDGSVVRTLDATYSKYVTDYFFDHMIFANGGDRTEGNSPEEKYCQWKQIKTVYGVGGGKTQSSSSLLKDSSIDNIVRKNQGHPHE
jgi:D-beta-D-heptose 7-phosphate kinase/D-beta-D-heptose 1-phosphate adenosyltransferase